jgi:chromate reductase
MKVVQPIIKVLGISGSLKKASVNRGALEAMKAQASTIGIDMTIADLSDIPFFNPDTEHEAPESVQNLVQQMKDADAFVFATPE